MSFAIDSLRIEEAPALDIRNPVCFFTYLGIRTWVRMKKVAKLPFGKADLIILIIITLLIQRV